MNVHLSRLEGDARAPFSHIQGIGHAENARLQGQRISIGTVRDDGMEDF